MKPSTCAACVAFDRAERAAIEGAAELPGHTIHGCTCTTEPAVAMTIFPPEAMFTSPHRGTVLGLAWPELVRFVSMPIVTSDKASAGGFTLARLRDGIRRKDHVESVSAIAVEHDAGRFSPETAHESLRLYRHIVYSTASHTTVAPRWRAVIAVSRSMTPAEHAAIWARIARIIERDTDLDESTKDPCRYWYTPTRPPGATHLALAGDGPPLDVDAVLRMVRARPRATSSLRNTAVAVAAKGSSYLSVAVEQEVRAVANAPEGTRNKTLNRAAYSLARLAVSKSQIERCLLAAAKRAGLSEREAAKTIASGITARRARA